MNSHTVRAMDLYSTSAVDQATTDCLLLYQEIGDLPRRTQKLVVDLLVEGHPAQ